MVVGGADGGWAVDNPMGRRVAGPNPRLVRITYWGLTNALYEITLGSMAAGIGRKMRRTRIERDVTQAQLGSILGCGQSMVEQTESGVREPGDELRRAILKWIASGTGAGTKSPRGAYRR